MTSENSRLVKPKEDTGLGIFNRDSFGPIPETQRTKKGPGLDIEASELDKEEDN